MIERITALPTPVSFDNPMSTVVDIPYWAEGLVQSRSVYGMVYDQNKIKYFNRYKLVSKLYDVDVDRVVCTPGIIGNTPNAGNLHMPVYPVYCRYRHHNPAQPKTYRYLNGSKEVMDKCITDTAVPYDRTIFHDVGSWLSEYGLEDTLWMGSSQPGLERHMVPASDAENITIAESLTEIVGQIRENRNIDEIDSAMDNISYNAIYPKYPDDPGNWTFFRNLTVGKILTMLDPFATMSRAKSIRERIGYIRDKDIELIDLSVPGARSLILELEESSVEDLVMDLRGMDKWRRNSPLSVYTSHVLTERSFQGKRIEDVVAYKTEGEEVAVVFLDEKGAPVKCHYMDLPTYSIGSLSFIDSFG